MSRPNFIIERDLFGEQVPAVPARKDGKSRKIGYAARPGSGPKGQRCGNCQFAQRVVHRGQFTHKCELMTFVWRHGSASDIHLQAPACLKWARKPYTRHAHRD